MVCAPGFVLCLRFATDSEACCGCAGGPSADADMEEDLESRRDGRFRPNCQPFALYGALLSAVALCVALQWSPLLEKYTVLELSTIGLAHPDQVQPSKSVRARS
jgi:hypothetical protein